MKSCGGKGKNNFKYRHGFKGSRFYEIWRGFRNRCNNKKNYSYFKYGAIGIRVCKRWEKFENFRDDMYTDYLKHVKKFGEYDTTLDRINTRGDYKKLNCLWATKKIQGRNKRNNRIIKINGEMITLKQLSEETGINYNTLYGRIVVNKIPISKALTKRSAK